MRHLPQRLLVAPGLRLGRRATRRVCRLVHLAQAHAVYAPRHVYDRQTKWSCQLIGAIDADAALRLTPPPITTRAGRRIARVLQGSAHTLPSWPSSPSPTPSPCMS